MLNLAHFAHYSTLEKKTKGFYMSFTGSRRLRKPAPTGKKLTRRYVKPKTKKDKQQDQRLRAIEKFLKGDQEVFQMPQQVLTQLVAGASINALFDHTLFTSDSITTGKMKIRVYVNNLSAESLMYRLILLKYRCPITAGSSITQPTITDVLTADQVLNAHNYENRDNYKIHYDKRFTTRNYGASVRIHELTYPETQMGPMNSTEDLWLPYLFIVCNKYVSNHLEYSKAFEYVYITSPKS